MKKLYSIIFILFPGLTTYAQTNVSGGIYANTTWTLAGSPYIVVDTVVVFPGVTLTIDPGVVVKFDNNKRLDIREATLIAEGTITDSIKFTSNASVPTPGVYSGLHYINLSLQRYHSQFNYCSFEYANLGISANSDNDSITIKNSIFINNNIGIGFIYSTLLLIDSCSFKYNNYGVKGYNYGIQMSNSIITNNQNGILGTEMSKFIHCVIDSNSVIGITASQFDSIMQCEIKYNGVGIDVSDPVGIIIAMNVIENNYIGIRLCCPNDNNIFCNRICSNTSYDLEYTYTLSNVSLPNNYWCTPDSLSTTLRIYDGYDDVSLGLVNFMPLDTLNCYLTGCNLGISANATNATCDTCHNGAATAIVTNGFSPYSYTWYTSPIQYTQTATALAAGTYTVCVTDANGCTACNYNIFVDSTNCTGFTVSAMATNASCSSCSDGTATATITAGNPPYYYQWNTVPIQNTQTATGLSGGNYVVCVSDVYGCSACDSVSVGIGSCYAYYTIAASGSPSTYDLTNMATGTPPLTFDWSWGDGSPNDTGAYPSHTYATSGNYTICLNITDSAGCTDSYCNTFYLFAPSSTPVTINVIPPISSGVVTAKEEKSFTVYPNPTSEDITVQLQNASDAIISIYNTLGDKVYSTEITNRDSYTVHTAFPKGIYFIEVRGDAGVSRERFVKQ
jgi:hypothetical protein